MKSGDKAIWLYEARGGYGFVYRVPCEVVKVTAKRVVIRAVNRLGNTVERAVKPEKLEVVKG